MTGKHKIIQASFGWQDYHLFDFDLGDMVVHIPDPDYAPGELYGGKEELHAKRTKIDALLVERKRCIYTLETTGSTRSFWKKKLPAEDGRHYPFCIAGARHSHRK